MLRSPKETRHAIHYVLFNAKKHGIGARARGWVDAMSSAPWFPGWATPVRFGDEPPPTARAETWLLKIGWARGGGPLGPDHAPGSRRAAEQA